MPTSMTDDDIPTEAVVVMVKANLATPREWDGPPDLCLMYRHTFGFAMATVPLPTWMWEMAGHPVEALRGFTDIVTKDPKVGADLVREANVPGGGMMVGLALQFEAWVKFDADEKVRAALHAREVQVRDLPDRIEMRSVGAVDTLGRYYLATMRRETGEVEVNHSGDERGFRAEGRLPDALGRFLDALVAAQGAAYS